MFIIENQLKWDSLSEAFICEKALSIYADPAKKTLGANSNDLISYQADRGSKSLKKEVELTVCLDLERRQVKTRRKQRSFKKKSVTSSRQKVLSHNMSLMETKQVYLGKSYQIALL